MHEIFYGYKILAMVLLRLGSQPYQQYLLGSIEMAQSKGQSSSSMVQAEKQHRVKKYSTIQYSTRRELIRKVVHQGRKLTEVSKELGIKLSTSKFIIKSFKKYGRIFRKKSSIDEDLSMNNLQETEEKVDRQPVSSPEEKITYVYYPIYVYVPVNYQELPTGPTCQLASYNQFSVQY